MSHEILVFAIIADVALTLALFWQVRFVIRAANERADRATAALLHVAGETKAAHVLVPPPPAPHPADGRTRMAQVGLSPR